MSDIDASPMAVWIVALGRTIQLRCRSDATVSSLRRTWSRCLATALPTEDAPSITVEGHAPHELMDAVTAAAVQPHIGSSVLLQAAALADSRGQAVVLLGGFGAGRTTAAEHLGRRLGYVTDERVAIAPHGDLSPFDRPLLRRTASGDWEPEALSPDDLNLVQRPDSIKLRRLLVLTRDGTSPPALEALDDCDSLLELASHAVFLDYLDLPLQQLYAAIRRAGGVHRLRYGEIDEACELIDTLLDAQLPVPPEGQPLEAFPKGAGMARWGLMDGRIRRAPYRDAVLLEEDIVLYVREKAIRLSGIGTTVWEEAAGLTLEELTERVEVIHGPHPNAAELVIQAVEELALAGVVARFYPQRLDQLPLLDQAS